MSSKVFKLLLLFLIWLFYVVIGVFIFKAVEGNDDIDTEKIDAEMLEKIKRDVTAKYNMTESEFDNIVQQIQEGSSASSGPRWTYTNTISFIIQLLTTIGYGNITPVTSGGRILCIFYAFFGIPINIFFLQVTGEVMMNGQQALVTRFETRCLKRERDSIKFVYEKCTMLGFLLLLSLLLVSAGIEVRVEDWTFLEGFYSYFITFTTVGFGDLIPGRSTTKKGHVALQIIFIIFGLAAMSNMLNAIAKCQDTGQLFKRIKARFGRTGGVEVGEHGDGADMEMNENNPKS